MNLKKLKVLIADNDTECVDSLIRTFKTDSDIESIYTVDDGEKVFKRIIKYNIDILIINTTLPEIDGIEVIDRLKELNLDPEFIKIAISNSSNDAIINSAIDAGTDFFFVKPLNVGSVLKRIKYIARNKFFSNKNNKREYIRVREVESEYEIAAETANLIHQVGVPQHLIGYQYLKEAICMGFNDDNTIKQITKFTYPSIAKRHLTSAEKVERSIRSAIEATWAKDSENLNLLFKQIRRAKRPTNSEFIAVLSDKLRYELKEKGYNTTMMEFMGDSLKNYGKNEEHKQIDDDDDED